MTKQQEEEISVSWLKGILKGKPNAGSEIDENHSATTDHAPAEHESHASHKKFDDEQTIDLGSIGSTIKGWLGKDHSKDDVDRITFNPRAAWRTLVKYNALIFILIAICFSAYLRAQPWIMPITDNWAADTLHNNIKGQIAGQLQRQYPNLPSEKRNELIDVEFKNYLKQAGPQLDEQIKAQSEYFKSRYRTPEGEHMLLDIDSYAYYRETWNFVTYGHLGNTLVNGTPWDTFVLAPLGIPPGDNMHIHLGAWLYKLWHTFDPNVTVLTAMFWLPFLIALIAPIPAFFIGRKFAGPIGGFFAALYIAINPAMLARTSAGVPDTDVYSIVFPLLVIWAYLEAFDAPTRRRQYIWAGLAGLFSGLYAWGWSGWWHVLIIIVAGTGTYVVLRAALSLRKEPKRTLETIKTQCLILATYLTSSIAFVTALRDFQFVIESIKQPFAFILIQQAAHDTLWPNVYTTVAELNTVDFNGILGSIGGWTYVIIAFFGIIFAMTKKDEHGWYDFKFGLMLLFWIAATMYASTKGVRFLMLLSIPIAICISSFVGNLCEFAGAWLKRTMDVPAGKHILAVILFVMLIFSNLWPAAKGTSTQNIPLINDAWWNTLVEIDAKANPDAIITSWWDFGHWFKAIAKRPVTFDGGTQNTPVAHWVGKILMTSDEAEAMGILRMLNCGSNRAAELIDTQLNKDTDKTVDILYRIFKLSKDASRAELVRSGITNPDHILEYTHCNPPQSFVIASDDMIGKGGVWAHFGSWNFTRAQLYVETKNMTRAQAVEYAVSSIGLSPDVAPRLVDELRSQRDDRSINTWISPWPGYAGATQCKRSSEMVRCQNGVEINMSTFEVNDVNGAHAIKRFIYIKDGVLLTKPYNTSINDLDGLLLPSATDDYTMIFAQYPLGSGLFTRMFYLEGAGLQYFDKFSDKTGVTGTRVITYVVDWRGNSTNYPYGGAANVTAALRKKNATNAS
ncbi:hypothetical protein HY641_02355 [Candidatus Woesearchaeota archaeon]|nr:hypothetical protein [Candidatus Woesearchaeota archaeon]